MQKFISSMVASLCLVPPMVIANELVLPGATGGVSAVDCATDVPICVFVTKDRISVWDHRSGIGYANRPCHDQNVIIRITPDGTKVAFGTGGSVYLCDAKTGRELAKIKVAAEVVNIDVSRDGERIAIGCWDGMASVYDTRRDSIVYSRKRGNGWTAVALSPNGTELASGGSNGTVDVNEISAGNVSKSWRPHRGLVTKIRFSRTGKYLVSAGKNDHRLVLRNLHAERLERAFEVNNFNYLRAIDIAGDDKLIAAATGIVSKVAQPGNWGEVWIWSIETGELVLKRSINPVQVSTVSFTNAPATVAVDSENGLLFFSAKLRR